MPKKTAPTGTLAKQIRRFMSQMKYGEGTLVNNILTNEQLTFIADELALFCERAIAKFAYGQEQHGGHFPFDASRSFLAEMDGKLIDLFFYSRGMRKKLERL